MKKLLIITLFFALYSILYTAYPTSTQAADSTPSSSVQQKLDALKKEIASKAASLKQVVNEKLQNKAYVGVIKKKADSSITMAAKSGTKLININQDTTYQDLSVPRAKAATAKTLVEEQFIVAMGDIDESDVLTAKKIIILPQKTKDQPVKTSVWGQVSSKTDSTITVTDREQKVITISISNNTDLKSGSEDTTLDQINKGDSIIASGYSNSNNILAASLIYLIPNGEKPMPTPTASSSAKPTPKAKVATASAKPK